MKAVFPDTLLVDGIQLATQAGNPRTVNVVLLGAMAGSLPIEAELWRETLRRMVPSRFLDMNLKAFDFGCQAASALR